MTETLDKLQETHHIRNESGTQKNIPENENISCSCGVQHNSKEMLNQVYDLSVNFLWESIFGPTQFCYNYWQSRKFYDFVVSEWKQTGKYIKSRTLTYKVDLGSFGTPKNVEEQRVIEYIPNTCIVLESESQTYGILYSDYFKARNRFCMTKISENKTRLLVTSELKFLKKPNFLAKGIIDRNAMGALKDSYQYLNEEIPTLRQPKNYNSYNISAIDDKEFNQIESNTKLSEDKKILNNENSKEDVEKSTPINNIAYKRRNTNMRSSYKSINSYNDYLDVNNHERSKLTTKESYPSLYNSQDQPKVMEPNSDKTDYSEQEQSPKIRTIQTFTFLSFVINIDTLVRLFIIAMVCLMLINGLLYYKLLKIENIAKALKNKKIV